MFDRLRHRAVVGCDHQQHMIDASRAGQHVVNEFFVTRHVDETQHLTARQGLIRVAEIDRDAARLLFLEAIGIDAGQCLDQRGLAMVDVTSGTDNHDQACEPCSKCDVK